MNPGPTAHRSPLAPPNRAHRKNLVAAAIVARRVCQAPPEPGVESPPKGRLIMHLLASETCSRDLDQLGDEIAELSAHLDAATARLLDLIREFDARGGWGNGFRSCAEWLSWRVGLDLGAARERVRVARALEMLPL